MRIQLANPRGFCAGVDRAIEIVERALDIFGAPIYVRHEVVHNTYVVNCLKKNGAIFVEELSEIPDDATVIFSAHGVSQAVQNEAKSRQLKVFDATCPLVTKVHMEVSRYAQKNINVILIGHTGHPEVDGTMGQFDSDLAQIFLVENTSDVENLDINNRVELAYVTQTTLSVDDTKDIISKLKNKFPNIQGPKKDDICYATQNRQDAIKSLTHSCELILVVGSPNSSNSNRLKELAIKNNIPGYLVDNAEELKKEWFKNIETVGLSAGASAPELLVDDVIKKIKEWFGAELSSDSGPKENIIFQLPKDLR
ncbi:MAG: 4-hydroxy-3-methylbut-2-enyl diphosphate reductase [endosymbiont of Galathealinum brachiosum]|uniref:4-hydroxy-3-methylbut-2-enyl diphosphate reductase n=1 Tax=endosymbiont of Galathealinum brachiosum TaxID=2200906 RepID=A0A370DCG7_9GAMM|nr:MAG: 4-hydroxy-3-methylbut-2-enyl diphosphate reductase [endosymbiont of Galathealinum brachiosum]